MKQNILRCLQIEKELEVLLNSLVYDECFVLVDENTFKFCLPIIEQVPQIYHAKKIIILSGEENKNLYTVLKIWNFFKKHKATRKSLLINLGGGMVTDLGGFASSIFKRGISFINIPTTLLGVVDAAIGGKTGINFDGLKNELGSFALAKTVLIDSVFFQTLSDTELLAGYAEMLKHALLYSVETTKKLLSLKLEHIKKETELISLVLDSIQIKERIVNNDPKEQNIRKALNFGHTFGHAFESLSYEIIHPVPHGWAVAWGMVCELYLSYKLLGFPESDFMQIILFIKKQYNILLIDYIKPDLLIEKMKHDKKNTSQKIHFTLLSSIGKFQIDQTTSIGVIKETLDFFKNFFIEKE